MYSVDFEVGFPPSDSISALEFSPAPNNLLCAGSWDQTVRTWQVSMNGTTTPKSFQQLTNPVLDVSWSDDGSKLYLCTTGPDVHQWDLQENKLIKVGMHDAGVRTCHWIRAPNYACLMTASWDKTIKFWDTRSPAPMLTLNLPERCYAAQVSYPLAAVVCACNSIMVYSLDRLNMDFVRVESTLKHQTRCIDIFRYYNKELISGFVVGGILGRVAVHYLSGPHETFAFKCHRSVCPAGFHNIYAVNDVKLHPVHNTLATIGSDGIYCYWDSNSRSKLITSSAKTQALTKCCFNSDGQIFAYASGYDWAQGHEHFDINKKPTIYLHPCFEEMKLKK